MISRLLLAALLALLPLGAEAANCNSNPFTLTNGQTADATQVMANFNNLLNCSNNNLAHNGANSDITSLSGLTTPLSVPQGGTGATSFTATAGLLTGNGASAFSSIAPSTSGNLLQSTGAAWASANTLTGPYAFTGAVNHQATLTMSGAALNEAAFGAISSATTTDLNTVATNWLQINGTTTITSFGTPTTGLRKTVYFAGVLTLTNNSNILLPGAANITTAVGDTATFIATASGWICVTYTKASGQPAAAATGAITKGTTNNPSVTVAKSNGATTVAHGLGRQPDYVFFYLQNIVSELGYSIGDRSSAIPTSTGGASLSVSSDATNTVIQAQNVTMAIPAKATGVLTNITPGSWNIVAVPVIFNNLPF